MPYDKAEFAENISTRKGNTMSIKRIPYSAPREEFIRAIEQDGCVIIQNFTTKEKLAQAQREVQPYLDADEKTSTVGG